MILSRLLFLTGLCLAATVTPGFALDVLFVGNSFTYGSSTYNAGAITDANGTGQGGVPAAFAKMAAEGGHAGVNVTIEAVSGQTLAYHFTSKSAAIGKRWDYVVLQEHSLGPLVTYSGGNVAAFRKAVGDISTLVKQYNSAVRVLLYETWARPDFVPENYPSMQVMQDELSASYSAAAADYLLHGWVPVGDAFMRSVSDGVAYDPDSVSVSGKFNLWGGDNYHHSNYGCYLSALLFYVKILGGDPRVLPTGAGSAAAGLGINATNAASLQQIAYVMIPPAPASVAIVKQPSSVNSFAGMAVTFSVTASGAGLSYQWRHNSVSLPDETAATLRLANVQAADAGNYDVVVTAANIVITSAPATLAITSRQSNSTWLFDVGSSSAGYPTPSPDSSGLYWNQFSGSAAGAQLSSICTSTGTIRSSVSLFVVTSFSGINQGGMNINGAYPATAQIDSFYVTGTGTSGNSRKGQLRFAGLDPSANYTVKLYAARSGSGSRVVRFTVDDVSPVYLQTMNNSRATVSLGPVQSQLDGTLSLSVEPYDAAGTLQEYGYLNVIEITESVPTPSAYENWSSRHGLAAGVASIDADPDGDGQANLLEFAMGTNPTSPHTSVGLQQSMVTSGGENYLSMSLQKNPDAAGLLYSAEVSADLINWTGDTTVEADTTAVFQARDNVSVTGSAHRFLRLRVTTAPWSEPER